MTRSLMSLWQWTNQAGTDTCWHCGVLMHTGRFQARADPTVQWCGQCAGRDPWRVAREEPERIDEQATRTGIPE